MDAFRYEVRQSELFAGTELERRLVHDTDITVYVPLDRSYPAEVRASDRRRFGGDWETGVNWSAMGTQPVAVAAEYARALAFAVQLIEGVRLQREHLMAQIAETEALRERETELAEELS